MKALFDKARLLNSEIGVGRLTDKNCFVDFCNLIVDVMKAEDEMEEREVKAFMAGRQLWADQEAGPFGYVWLYKSYKNYKAKKI